MSQTNARFQQGGIILPQGSSPGNVNVGEKALILDTDGSVKTQDSAGTKSPISATSLSPFQTRMNALCDSLVTLTGKRYLALGAYPSGVAIASLTNNQTAMSGSGVAATATPLALTNNLLQTPKTLPWFVAGRCIATGTFSAAKYGLFGLHDGTNDFVRVGYAGGDSNSFWRFDVGHGGSGTTVVTSVALDTVAHDHAVFYDGSTAAKYYIDGVLAQTISNLTNFPTTAQVIMGMATGAGGGLAFTVTEIFSAFNET